MARQVGSCAVELALECVTFAQQLVPFGDDVLVLGSEPVTVVFDPGAVGLSQLSDQVGDEATFGLQVTAQVADLLCGVECPLSRHDASCWAVILSLRRSARAWLRAWASAMIELAASFS